MYPDTLPIYVSHQDNIIIVVVEMKHKLKGGLYATISPCLDNCFPNSVWFFRILIVLGNYLPHLWIAKHVHDHILSL